MSAPEAIVHAAGEGDHRLFFGGGIHTWKLRAEETGGAFFLFEDELTEGKATPLHAHPEAAETLYVLEGEILVSIGGSESLVGAGGVTFVPNGVPHAFLVTSPAARLLTLQAPGIGQNFYRSASEEATGSTTFVPDIARLQACAQANPRGITLLGPPPFQPAPAR